MCHVPILRLCRLSIAVVLAAWVSGLAASHTDGHPLRFGVTPVFLDDQVTLLEKWRDYLGRRLGREVRFVQRTSYREITDMLVRGELDFAWLCGFPYVKHRSALTLVAVPLYNNSPLYQSYLIVPVHDRDTATWTDLDGAVFAFSDPDSNSGYLYPRVAMLREGIEPDRTFRKSFFSWGHRNVVEAVAVGLADAGAVDGYVWEALSTVRPELTIATRVVAKSPWFGFPPVVAGKRASAQLVEDMRRTLLAMDSDIPGAGILAELALDGFTEGKPSLYDSIAEMAEVLQQGTAHAR